jgi:hypothetical protein
VTQHDYRCSITGNISPAEAFERICRVSDWWTAGTQGISRNLGDEFAVNFGETFVTFKVTELVPGKKAVWLVTACNLHWINNKTEWQGTKVVWDLSSENGQTHVTMTHVGLVPGVECYNDCSIGWNFCVGESLLKLLTEGIGLPDKGGKRSQKGRV